MVQEMNCISRFYQIMLILGNLQKKNLSLDHGINFAINLTKKTLKSQFSRISIGTNTGELSLIFI